MKKVLKRLKNKFLIMNMASTFFLLIISFAVIFSLTYSSTEREIEKSLFRAFAASWQPRNHQNFKIDRRPEFKTPGGKRPQLPQGGGFRDTRVFSLVIEKDGSFLSGKSMHIKYKINKIHIKTLM